MAELDQSKPLHSNTVRVKRVLQLGCGCTAYYLCQPCQTICTYIAIITPAISLPRRGHATKHCPNYFLAGLTEDESQSGPRLPFHHRPTIAAARLHLRSWILPARQPAPCVHRYTNRTHNIGELLKSRPQLEFACSNHGVGKEA
jgi:hypothetical protein